MRSLARILAAQPEDIRERTLRAVPKRLRIDLLSDWRFIARPEQLAPPGRWSLWRVMAGRGFGKNRCGAEWLLDRLEDGFLHHGALVSRTIADVRDTMIQGPDSGLLVCAERRRIFARYIPSKRVVALRTPGSPAARQEATLITYTSDEPEQLRGPEHDSAHADEISAWTHKRDSKGNTAWTNLTFTMRYGPDPRIIATFTPKPNAHTRAVVAATRAVDTRGSMLDNRDNLPESFVQGILETYEGTALGVQEIHGVLVDAVEGALWTEAGIDAHRWDDAPSKPRRIAIGVDPAAEQGEHGIVVVGVFKNLNRWDLGVVADYTVRGKPETWAARVLQAFDDFDCDEIAAERNQGGQMVESAIRAASGWKGRLPISLVRAVDNKRTRAEPISILAEKGRLHMIGSHPLLEAQMVTWDPDDDSWSPDRIDALVWACTRLLPYIQGTGVRKVPTGEIPTRRR